MIYTVHYVGWTNGEKLASIESKEAPYVPQLKSCVVVGGIRYIVGSVDSELVRQERGMDADWLITVKLAKS